MAPDDLLSRVQALQDQQEIEDITYQYWYAIDSKNPETLKDVFSPHEIYIDFNEGLSWTDREEFVRFYASLALDPVRNENHFASTPIIEIKDADNAYGHWRAHVILYNFGTSTIIRITGEYDIDYVRVDGQWKIRSFVFNRHSLFAQNVAADGKLAAPGFGGYSAAAHAHLLGKDA